MNTSNHLSGLKLEAILSGQFDPDKDPVVKAHLAECSACTEYLKNAPSFSEPFAAKYPDVDSLLERSRNSAPIPVTETLLDKFKHTIAVLFSPRPALAFASLVLVFVAGFMLFMPAGNSKKFVVKGDAFYTLWVNGNVVSGQTITVKPGDTLQLGVTGKKPMNYSILYQDDNGLINTYLSGESSSVGKPHCELLPHSIVLNSGWKEEILYCILSDTPLTPENAGVFINQYLNNKQSGNHVIIQKYRLLNQ